METMKAIITGGSRGIGKGIAVCLAKAGYDVAITYATCESAAVKTAQYIKDTTGRACHIFKVSFDNDITEMKTFMKNAIESLGGLDVMVNNAAITGVHQPIFNLSDDYLLKMVNVNFNSFIVGMREASIYMAKNGIKGSIINISSVRGQNHCAFPHDGIYGGTKAGLDRAIQSFALCLAPYGIRINNIAPGAIRNRTYEEAKESGVDISTMEFRDSFANKKIPLQRMGEPEDVAEAVAFLASEKASYITGITLNIDGGLILPGMPERKPEPDSEDRGWGYFKKIERWDND